MLALLLLPGCSDKPIPGTGDVGGRHLVAFASDRNQPAGQYDLYLWDFDEARFRPLNNAVATTAAERHPTISNDGRFIAFHSDRGGGTLDDIYIYDRANPQQFVSLPGLNSTARETEPSFTGDGLDLTFVQQVGAYRRIRLYDGESKTLIALPGLDTTGATYNDYAPAPNRDGSTIAFVSDRSGNPDIFLYSRSLRRVLELPELRSAGSDVDPRFSNSGRYFAWSSDRAGGSGGFDVFLLEFDVRDTSEIDVRAANSAFADRRPAVNDAGGTIVFQSDRPEGLGRFDLWRFVRGAAGPTQDPGLPSGGDDIEPSLHWQF